MLDKMTLSSSAGARRTVQISTADGSRRFARELDPALRCFTRR